MKEEFIIKPTPAKATSWIWKYFKIIHVRGDAEGSEGKSGKRYARCQLCEQRALMNSNSPSYQQQTNDGKKKKIAQFIYGKSQQTSSLLRHVEREHLTVYEQEKASHAKNKCKKNLNPPSPARKIKRLNESDEYNISKRVISPATPSNINVEELLAGMYVYDLFDKGSGCRNGMISPGISFLLNSLYPLMKIPNEDTMAVTLLSLKKKVKDFIIEELIRTPFISLCLYEWKQNDESLVSRDVSIRVVSVHWISHANFKRFSFVLGIQPVRPAGNLSMEAKKSNIISWVETIFMQYNIDDKYISMTTQYDPLYISVAQYFTRLPDLPKQIHHTICAKEKISVCLNNCLDPHTVPLSDLIHKCCLVLPIMIDQVKEPNIRINCSKDQASAISTKLMNDEKLIVWDWLTICVLFIDILQHKRFVIQLAMSPQEKISSVELKFLKHLAYIIISPFFATLDLFNRCSNDEDSSIALSIIYPRVFQLICTVKGVYHEIVRMRSRTPQITQSNSSSMNNNSGVAFDNILEEAVNMLEENLLASWPGHIDDESFLACVLDPGCKKMQFLPSTSVKPYELEKRLTEAFHKYGVVSSENFSQYISSEITDYLNEPEVSHDISVLSYWRNRKDSYPHLSQLALFFFTIQATCSPSYQLLKNNSRTQNLMSQMKKYGGFIDKSAMQKFIFDEGDTIIAPTHDPLYLYGNRHVIKQLILGKNNQFGRQ